MVGGYFVLQKTLSILSGFVGKGINRAVEECAPAPHSQLSTCASLHNRAESRAEPPQQALPPPPFPPPRPFPPCRAPLPAPSGSAAGAGRPETPCRRRENGGVESATGVGFALGGPLGGAMPGLSPQRGRREGKEGPRGRKLRGLYSFCPGSAPLPGPQQPAPP